MIVWGYESENWNTLGTGYWRCKSLGMLSRKSSIQKVEPAKEIEICVLQTSELGRKICLKPLKLEINLHGSEFAMWIHCCYVQTLQKRESDLITSGCEPPFGCRDLNLGPSEEQSVLLTAEPSLHTQNIFFCQDNFRLLNCVGTVKDHLDFWSWSTFCIMIWSRTWEPGSWMCLSDSNSHSLGIWRFGPKFCWYSFFWEE